MNPIESHRISLKFPWKSHRFPWGALARSCMYVPDLGTGDEMDSAVGPPMGPWEGLGLLTDWWKCWVYHSGWPWLVMVSNCYTGYDVGSYNAGSGHKVVEGLYLSLGSAVCDIVSPVSAYEPWRFVISLGVVATDLPIWVCDICLLFFCHPSHFWIYSERWKTPSNSELFCIPDNVSRTKSVFLAPTFAHSWVLHQSLPCTTGPSRKSHTATTPF